MAGITAASVCCCIGIAAVLCLGALALLAFLTAPAAIGREDRL